MLDCIPSLITIAQNEKLIRMPELEEVKRVIFLINRDSASGRDGFSEVFYQQC